RSAVTDFVQEKPVGFTMGDAAGIGPEIIVKLFDEGLPTPAVVYGDAGILQAAIARMGLGARLRVVDGSATDLPNPTAGCIPVLNRWHALPSDLPPGRPDPSAGRAAYEFLCHAIDDALDGKLRAIVTAPLNKKTMQAGGADYPGHTEILAERSNTQHYAMMLAIQELRVFLVTIHVACRHISEVITVSNVRKTDLLQY